MYIMGLVNRMQQKIGLWLRGQLILSLIIFVLTYIGLSILKVVITSYSIHYTKLYDPSSIDKVLLQLPTAPLVVLLTPNPGIGSFTEVEMILTIRP